MHISRAFCFPGKAEHLHVLYVQCHICRAVKGAHDRYVVALRGLWDAHKGRYAMERKGTLKIVDLPPQLLQH